MHKKEQFSTSNPKEQFFTSNPYDIEIIFESLVIASKHNKNFIFMDMLLDHVRRNGKNSDLTQASYHILAQLGLLNMKFR